MRALYVVHHLDIGKPVKTIRVAATLILKDGEIATIEEFVHYLNVSGAAYKAALVDENGIVVFNDPRHFA